MQHQKEKEQLAKRSILLCPDMLGISWEKMRQPKKFSEEELDGAWDQLQAVARACRGAMKRSALEIAVFNENQALSYSSRHKLSACEEFNHNFSIPEQK